MRQVSRIAIIWPRFGPYHIARLEAAGKRFRQRGIEVVGLEVARTDSTYAWNITTEQTHFERVTIFDDENYHTLRRQQIGEGVARALTVMSPDAVAIDGWFTPGARAALRWCKNQRRAAICMSESFREGARRIWWKEVFKRRIVAGFCSALVGGQPHAEYAAELGIPRDRIFLGYDAVDNWHFGEGAERVRSDAFHLRKDFDLPERYFYANTRFLPRKNVDGLLRAYAHYRQDAGATAWGLVITGSGQSEAQLKALAKGLRLHDVVWPGFVQYQDLPVYYGLASAFVHPAKSEAWGLVVNEAMASGLPVLVSEKVGSRFSLLRSEENGFLFDPFDLDAIATALRRMAESPEASLQAMGNRSREIVADWGPERFADGLWQAACTATYGHPDRSDGAPDSD